MVCERYIHTAHVCNVLCTCEWRKAHEGDVGQCNGQGEDYNDWPCNVLADKDEVQIANSSLVHL